MNDLLTILTSLSLNNEPEDHNVGRFTYICIVLNGRNYLFSKELLMYCLCNLYGKEYHNHVAKYSRQILTFWRYRVKTSIYWRLSLDQILQLCLFAVHGKSSFVGYNFVWNIRILVEIYHHDFDEFNAAVRIIL